MTQPLDQQPDQHHDDQLDVLPSELVTDQSRSAAHPATVPPQRRTRNQRGEGVISTAIAVLVVAFIGIGLWQGFDAMVDSASSRTRAQVDQIGR